MSATTLCSNRCPLNQPDEKLLPSDLNHDSVFCKLQVAEGDARVSVLQKEADRLNQALLRCQEAESAVREKAVSLSQTLQEVTASHSDTQTRLLALQKALSSSEQDRRLLQVRVAQREESFSRGVCAMIASFGLGTDG